MEAENSETYRGTMRLEVYWAMSILATAVFLFFTSMMMVPGVPSVDKYWMLSTAGVLLAVSLGMAHGSLQQPTPPSWSGLPEPSLL